MKPFVHLHLHTEFSLLDGATRIDDLIDETVKRGYSAVAITDHGNMYGALKLYEGCLKANIKPILGCEFYICHDRFNKTGKGDMAHIVLIAKNNKGYENLLKLSGIASKEGYYYKPRIDYKVLKEHSEGIICLSACLAGHIPQLILQGRMEDAKAMALELNSYFAPGDFYLEIQNHGIPEQITVLNGLEKISKETGIKLVATNDVHYLNKEDAEIQDVLMCVQMQKTIDDPTRMKFETDEFYYKTYEQMLEALPGYEEALDITNEIAAKCDVIIRSKSHGDIKGVDKKYVLPANENFIPYYQAPNGKDNYDYLREITYNGLKKKYGEPLSDKVIERAETELAVIHEQGFVEYFLVVWDYVNHARTHGISVGPGRGSGAGSIVAYAISITLIDPLKYDLFFERFINKERVSMPDFDVDFDYDKRGDIIEYVKEKYTPQNVASIGTFGTMAAKNAIRDVARVLKVPYSVADKISKQIPFKLPEGIKKPPVLKYYFGKTGKPENDKYIIPELRKLYDEDSTIKRVVDIALKMEGMPRNMSTHACGILIAPHEVDTYVPLMRNGEDISTQFSMIELEHLGLLKMDFLGLKTLTDIDKACQYVKETKGIDIDFYSPDMDYNNPDVYKMLSEGKTEAVFQLESGGFKKFLKELKPDCLEDIIAGVSLYRPGPMAYIPKYVQNKHNPELVKYAHPCLEPILNVTYGVIVYQEQVMQVCQAMGGYSLGQADNVRRIMGKKKKDQMVFEKEKFINGWEDPEGKKSIPGAVKLGVPKEVAEDVFGQMEAFASYAFNKSHAAAYSYLTFQTAYLKCYHEIELLTAVINNRITNADEIKHYITYAKKEKYPIYPPDINKSKAFFSVENGGMRYGLSGLKGVGVGVIQTIVAEREQNGEYKSFQDFINRSDQQVLNKKCLESLIFGGAFDCFGHARSALCAVYDSMIEKVNRDRKSRATGQFSIFDAFGGEEEQKEISDFDTIKIPDIKEFSRNAKLKFEKDVLGIYLSGHPLDEHMDKFDEFNLTSEMLVAESSEADETQEAGEEDERQVVFASGITDGMNVTCGGIVTELRKVYTKVGNREMCIVKLEDLYGTIELMMFPAAYDKYKNELVEDCMLTCKGKLSIRDGEAPIVTVERLIFWNADEKEEVEEKPKSNKTVYIKFDTKNTAIYNKVMLILSMYTGDTPVICKCTNTNQTFKINKLVNPNNLLINELIGVLDDTSVVVVEK
ncbi:MAG: DNA polymerase III subunit alpha [Clostridiales bacterium]|nr:DNA polymerase III subunit alpha [Clostridiales bacterium]